MVYGKQQTKGANMADIELDEMEMDMDTSMENMGTTRLMLLTPPLYKS